MQTDSSYTPLRNDFDEVVSRVFPAGLSDKQRETLKHFFFAGASAAYGHITDGAADTVYDELVDKAYKWEGVKEPKVA